MIEININNDNENQRMDKFLLKYLNKANKSFIYKMLRKKNIKLNGKKANGNEILKKGDNVALYLSDETINKFREYKKDYSNYRGLNKEHIIYEDENILVINKPVGVIVHSATNDEKENTLINSIIKYLIKTNSYNPEESNGFKPAICNRLDVNTSGIVVAGKNLRAVQELNEIFKTKKVDKFYETIVVGNITKDGEVKGYHQKDEDTNKATIYKENKTGDLKPVHTKYFNIKNNGEFTLLKIKLITGKTHQIRASMTSINNPIIGDRKYGDKYANEIMKKKYSLKNQLLHARSLTIKDSEGVLSYLNGKEFKADKPVIFNNIEKGLFK